MSESTVRRSGGLAATLLSVGVCLLAGCSNDAEAVNAGDEAAATSSDALSQKGEFYASQVKDTSAGHPSVDPMSLHPVPYFGWDQWFANELYKCWSTSTPPSGAPAATKYVCYHAPTSFKVGDGSLVSNTSGDRDNSMAPDATGVAPCGFPTFDTATATMSAVRYYDKNKNQLQKIRKERWKGKVYNGKTGKSVALDAESVWFHWENPVDGTADNEYFTAYDNVWGVRKSKDGDWIAKSWGEMTYSPGWEQLLNITGNHPIDDCGNLGKCGALKPVCDALK